MGKSNKGNKPSKNVFKVAGSRSFKAKNKAKVVSTQLKNLNEVNKRSKTADVDQQFDTLQEKVRQGAKKDETVEKVVTSRLLSKDVKQFEESEKQSTEALEKLLDMSMK